MTPKVDRLRDKLKTQLFRYANADRCHVQWWTVEYFHINKWKPFPFPLISPPRKVSASFHFYKSKEGNKHSLKLIKWWVHSHIFHEPEKGGVCSQIGSFIIWFYEYDGSKLICCFMFRESEMTKKTPKNSFFVNKASRSEKEITYPRLVDCSDSFTSLNVTSLLGNIFVFFKRLK